MADSGRASSSGGREGATRHGHIDKPRNFCQPAEVPRGRERKRVSKRKRVGCACFFFCGPSEGSGIGSGRSLNADKQNFLAAKLLTGLVVILVAPNDATVHVYVCVCVSARVCVCV